MKIHIKSLADIALAAQEFISSVGNARVIAFYGKMGAGKTTFIKAVCRELGVTDVITSPTFAIVNEYETDPKAARCHLQYAPSAVYHFDFYRIKKLEEVYDMGYEDYFYADGICLIEWPELIEELLPENALRVEIVETADASREIHSL